MIVNLAYGRTGLPVEFPDDRTTVIEPTWLDGLPDQAAPCGGRSITPWAAPPCANGCAATRPWPSPSAT